jgi:hypothetical protein
LRLVGRPKVLLVSETGSIAYGNKKYPGYIIKKYNSNTNLRSQILACQKELIEAGFEGNAAW